MGDRHGKFISFVRQGFKSDLPLGASGTGFNIKMTVLTGTGEKKEVTAPIRRAPDPKDDKAIDFHLIGPGDIIGIDPAQVVRVEPRPGTLDFERNYFPAVDFDRPDFPWLFTPMGSGEEPGGMKPWLVLITVKKRAGVSIRHDPNRPLPYLCWDDNERSESDLPDLNESWAWAHVQIDLEEADGDPSHVDIKKIIEEEPNKTVSRLLCPRRLEENKEYYACIVPAFKNGLLAGLGKELDPSDGPAWDVENKPNELPVYYSWEFSTGAGGDFESLAELLSPWVPSDEVIASGFGGMLIDCSDPGCGIAGGDEAKQLLRGALKTPLEEPEWSPIDGGVNDYRSALIDLTEQNGRLLAPPIYGGLQSSRRRYGSPIHWLETVNLDPKNRIAASLGVAVIRANQDELMAEAWRQAGDIDKANWTINQAKLSVLAGRSIWRNRLSPMDEQSLLQLTSKVHNRIEIMGKKSLKQHLRESGFSDCVFGYGFRKATRESAPARRYGSSKSTKTPVEIVVDLGAKEDPFFSTEDVLQQNGMGTLGRIKVVVQAKELKLDVNGLKELKEKVILSAPSASYHKTMLFFEDKQLPDEKKLPSNRVLEEAKRSVLLAMDPDRTILAFHSKRIIVDKEELSILDTIMTGPVFEIPTYEKLNNLSQDYFLPGASSIPPNSVVGLLTNPTFVNSFLVGLNHEMSREMRWREYPTDMRGTYFQHFWDSPAFVSGGGEDIEPINMWGNTRDLAGINKPEEVVLLIRADLLRRYPDTIVYAVPAVSSKNGKDPIDKNELVPDYESEESLLKTILFGTMRPDIIFFGFDLTLPQAIGDENNNGYFFVLQQPFTDIRFGLDEVIEGKATNNEPNWGIVDPSFTGYLEINKLEEWTDVDASCKIANAIKQPPFRVAIHARDLLQLKGS